MPCSSPNFHWYGMCGCCARRRWCEWVTHRGYTTYLCAGCSDTGPNINALRLVLRNLRIARTLDTNKEFFNES